MYQTIKPPEYLRKYIDCFWFGDDEDLLTDPHSHLAVATRKMEMLFFCRGVYASKDRDGKIQNVFKAGIYGHTTGFEHYFAASKRTAIFGIRFFPIACLALFGMPANELTDQKTEIENILGYDSKELTETIIHAETFLQKTRIACDYFGKRIKPLHIKYRSVQNALYEMHRLQSFRLSQMMSASCLSARQFERHFKELTGFSARTYQKLHRFEKLIGTCISSKNISETCLSATAFHFGYHDQSHFNRHFKEFTGVNPTTYFTMMVDR